MAEALSDREFIRYSRQLMLDQWQEEGQLRLKQAKVLIIGCGGLGNTAASLLAGAGVGQLTLMDDDSVELSNLPRQISYEMDDIDNAKAFALANRLREQNDDIEVIALKQRFDLSCAKHHLIKFDLVLDCSDNFTTRFLLNQQCVAAQLPLLSASVIGWHGQLLMITPKTLEYGCYQCVFATADDQVSNCNNSGVAGSAVAIVASYQANEAIRFLLGHVSALSQSILLIDTLSANNQLLQRTRNIDCVACGDNRSMIDAV